MTFSDLATFNWLRTWASALGGSLAAQPAQETISVSRFLANIDMAIMKPAPGRRFDSIPSLTHR